MTRIRLPYVQEWADRECRVHRYFRRPGFKRVRLLGQPGSTEFMRAYEGHRRTLGSDWWFSYETWIGKRRYRWLLHLPGVSRACDGNAGGRRTILERFRAEHGDKPLALMPTKFVRLALSTKAPFAASNWLQAIRALCRFAVAQEMVQQDVTQGIKLPRVRSGGHHTWTEAEIAQFEAAHPIGTKARLAFASLHRSKTR